MSNIERRYAKLDEGIFPEEGEYGVTYLTLYSSDAGNVYDGWVYDPEEKVVESDTPRTYGYRNPDYPQYCWDDELVVDLSNAQSRQESSGYTQGRITSFNTNVSSRPIILEDIDITGLTEEEREEKATVVLFSAIPLVQDAYIQANIEVQCKCNLSPDNTSGEMRVEAFYILNDESDRTMRPNPVHTFTVSSPNERHTLPWLYWNPALRHDTNNYIGVKLIATGGTVEIGISDDPDYGDAMITLASAGLTGDHIDSGKPVYLEMFGREEVVAGYKLDPDDYTVLCTYDTGEIYEVTRMCTFSPDMGTPIEQAFTTLTAHYQGLSASMTIRLGMVESIELSGLDSFDGKLLLDPSNYLVLAYLDTGDVMDVTAECTFSPAMGTTIRANTTLVATYSPFWMHGASFTDSIEITQNAVVATGYNDRDGLIYTLYNDNNIVITGNATHWDTTYGNIGNEIICVPTSLRGPIENSGYTLEWDAEGTVGGFISIADAGIYDERNHDIRNWKWLCKGFKGFDDVQISCINPSILPDDPNYQRCNYIYFSFTYERDLTSSMLRWLNNVDNHPIHGYGGSRVASYHPGDYFRLFSCCEAITSLDFTKNWTWDNNLTKVDNMCSSCISLKDISALRRMNFSNVVDANCMFMCCWQLESVNALDWNVSSLLRSRFMFCNTLVLKNADILWFWHPNQLYDLQGMFYGCGLDHVSFLKNWDKTSWQQFEGLVDYSSIIDLDGLQGLNVGNLLGSGSQGWKIFTIGRCPELLNLNGSEDWDFDAYSRISFIANPKLTDIYAVSEWDITKLAVIPQFQQCEKLSDLSPLSGWNTINIIYFSGALSELPSLEDVQPISGWDTRNGMYFNRMFYCDDKLRYISCLSNWDMSKASDASYMFARSTADEYNDFANTHIIDAGSLNWNVPLRYYPEEEQRYHIAPYWRCSWFWGMAYGADSSKMFFGTSWPDTNWRVHRNVNLSQKMYSIPFWYYHNDSNIDETR